MPTFMNVKAFAAAAAAHVLSASASSNICAAGSLPYFQCDFKASSTSSTACLPGVNTGEKSPDNSKCQAPSKDNQCKMYFDDQYKAWMWKSAKYGVECCNCFQTRPIGGCPPGSLPFSKCDFNSRYSSNSCYAGVNTGELAVPQSGECEPPSAENKCQMKFNMDKEAWMWKSDQVECCNCFEQVSGNSNLVQASAHRQKAKRGLRSSRGGEDSEDSSMLQVPLTDAGEEDYTDDETLSEGEAEL